MIKRIFDFSVALVGLIFLSPLFALMAILIKRDTPGPVLYRGVRMGKGGKAFLIIKFRTMYETEEASQGPRITAQDDARITRLGHFLRNSKLNELPQLINVLKGEMSLVGPRPEDPTIVKHYSTEQREVLSVRPGITSLASVIFVDEGRILNAHNVIETYLHSILPKKLRLDLLYVRNRTFLLDLDILFRTFWVFIPSFRKATTNAEHIVLGPFRWIGRLVSWFTIDAVIAIIAIGLASVIWRSSGPLDVGFLNAIIDALIMAGVFTSINAITGVQKVQWRYASASEAAGIVFSVGVATSLLVFIHELIPSPHLPSGLIIVAGIFVLAGFIIVRYRRQLFSGLNQANGRVHSPIEAVRERVLIVGSGEAGQQVIWLLQNSPVARAFHVVGVVDDDINKIGTLIHRTPVLGMTIRIPEIVEEHDIGLIVFAIHSIEPERRQMILQKCWKTKARTVVAPDILTFLHSEYVLDDSRMKVPLQAGLVQRTIGPEDLSEDALRQRIRDLAQLARLGDYATLTELLQKLDREIGREESEPDEVKKKKFPVESEVMK